MPSTSRAMSTFAANTLLILAMGSLAGAAQFTMIEKGCYSSSQPLKSIGTWTYQSSSYCQGQCEKQNAPVLGLSNGNLCWCGSELPAASTKVSDSECDTPCQGYPDESCGGGNDHWTIWLTGQDTDVPTYGGSSDTSSSSSSSESTSVANTPTTTSKSTSTSTTATTRPHRTTHKPHVVTSVEPGTTIVVTQPAAPSESSNTSKSSSSSDNGSTNVAGIAAGVVVGIVAAAAIVTGIYFWLRHRRRSAAEDEYKRTQVSDFMRGGSERKPPPTGYSSTSDSRLDPEAGARRNSHGSIADEGDYSRRILRVANPDNS